MLDSMLPMRITERKSKPSLAIPHQRTEIFFDTTNAAVVNRIHQSGGRLHWKEPSGAGKNA
jgi:hypothetical protein